MPTVPASHTVTGTIATTSEMNSFFRDPITFALNPPKAELRQTVAQSIPNGGFTSITFDAFDVDTDVDGVGGHDPVTNNSRYTARYPGWYQVSGGVSYAVNATGTRNAYIAVNGTTVNGTESTNAALAGVNIGTAARTKHIYLNVGDYVEIQAYQTSGGALNTAVSTYAQSSMTVRWVSN